MTSPTAMTRDELLEFAALDSYGLLDEYEAALYSRAFHQATPSLQKDVLELQAQIATDETLLPKETPGEELRTRVLRAVNLAIEQDTPTPLASIGRDVAARNNASGGQAVHADDSAGSFARFLSANFFWRAATFLLAGVVIAMAYVLTDAAGQHNRLTMAAIQSDVEQVEQLVGPTLRSYLADPATQRVVFTSENPDTATWATLMVLEGERKALLIAEGLSPRDDDRPYTLQVRDREGRVHQVASIDGRSQLLGTRVEVDLLAYGADARWEITSPDGVIMTGTMI